MNKEGYNELHTLCKKYINAGRNYYENIITPEDLLIETLIYMSDNGIIEYSESTAWVCIRKTRSKMVSLLFKQNPELYAKHLYYVRNYNNTNRERINALNRVRYRKIREEKGLDIQKVGAPSGSKHGKFKGLYHTPNGIFESSYEAAKALSVSHRCILYRCRADNFPDYYIEETARLTW